MPPIIRSIELPNYVRLPYAVQGDPAGIPVVFLHGFADSWRSFERVLAYLPGTIHALALTQRGHGDASRPAAGYSIRDLAGDLAAFLDALRLPAAVLVGHSMGSAVAQRFAIDHPARTRGLVLVGASPSLAASAAARAYWDPILSKLSDPVEPQLVREMTMGGLARLVPQAFLDANLAESLRVPAHVWRQVFASRWRGEGDFSGELGRTTAPTLVIWGDQDGRYPRSQQDALVAAIAGARLVVYAGAGHALHWEEPERFAADVAAFVGGLG